MSKRLDTSTENIQITVESNEHLEHLVVADGAGLRNIQVDVEAGGHYSLQHFLVGEERFEDCIQVNLKGEGSKAELSGLNLGMKKSEQSLKLQIHHQASNCESHQKFRGVMSGSSRGSFAGRIVVDRDVIATIAHQENKNLLLSDDAAMVTRPELQIDADDVACTHGATVGQLDESQLFYLASRGVDPTTARGMLVRGFAAEMLEGIVDPGMRDRVESRLDEVVCG